MARTLVGTFEAADSAHDAIRELQAAGVRSSQVRMMSGADGYRERGDASDGRNWADEVKDWFAARVGDDPDGAAVDAYAEAYRRGHVMVVAQVEETVVDLACAILERHGTIDLGRRVDAWRAQGFDGFDRDAPPFTAEERQEERGQVQRGAARVHGDASQRPS